MEITVRQVRNGWLVTRGSQVWVAAGRDDMLKIVKELSDDRS